MNKQKKINKYSKYTTNIEQSVHFDKIESFYNF